MLKSSPARGFYPAPLPGPHHYMDFLPRTHSLLHPLKSLGRLISDTEATLPLSLHGGAPPFLSQGDHHTSVLHEHMLSASCIPYLSQMLPGHPLYSKPEELAAVVTEHAAGPLSSDFSSPSSERSSSASSSATSPPKESLFRVQVAELSPEKTRTSYNFSEDDLFMVLYGYSCSQERRVGHAISGVALPENSGRTFSPIVTSLPDHFCQIIVSHRQLLKCTVVLTFSSFVFVIFPVFDSHILPLDKESLELPQGKPV